MNSDEPIALFLTWVTNGTWLPGDARGWVEHKHGWQLPSPQLEADCESRMTNSAVRLLPEQRRAVEDQIKESCQHRDWHLHAANYRTNHVHAVVSASETPPKKIRVDLKAYATRCLKALETIPERTMIFELWGNIGLRKGDYKLWSDIGREHSPDWDSLIDELNRTDLALFDLSKDVAEKNDLRTELPEVYSSLKTELIDHFANINTEYAGAKSSGTESSEDSTKENLKPKKAATTPAPKRRSQEQFFKNRDRNGDGVITLEEFIGNPKERNVPALTKRFKQLDSNKDGKLMLDELKNSIK